MTANLYTHVPRARGLDSRAQRVMVRLVITGLSLVLALGQPASALTPRSPKPGSTIVIRNDYGGSVRKRFNEIRNINQLRQKVEIRGSVCMSSCTMYLGVRNVCVSPNTTFGFHGPHRFGARLTSAEFNEWSNVIAVHYPKAVKTWYLQKARHQTYSVSRVKGSELIRLGVRRCR